MKSKIETVLYIRTSNAYLNSLLLQRIIGETYARQHSFIFEIVEEHFSGGKKSSEQPGMKYLLSLVESKKVKTKIVDSVHRISRYH